MAVAVPTPGGGWAEAGKWSDLRQRGRFPNGGGLLQAGLRRRLEAEAELNQGQLPTIEGLRARSAQDAAQPQPPWLGKERRVRRGVIEERWAAR